MQQLKSRLAGHKSGFKKVLDTVANENSDPSALDILIDDSDSYTLGIHLYKEHNCTTSNDFNKVYRVFILDQCSPSTMDVKEHKFIHLLKSLQPTGLNKSNPFNIPLLNS